MRAMSALVASQAWPCSESQIGLTESLVAPVSSSLSVLGGTLRLDALVSVDWSRMESAARGVPDLGSQAL